MSFCAQLAVFKLNLCRSITFRNIKNIDVPNFADELASFSSKADLSTADALVSCYNNGLTEILDVFAPVKTLSFTLSAPWFTPDLHLLKTKGCRLERLYAKSGLIVHKEMLTDHIYNYKEALPKAKSDYYSNIIGDSEGNSRFIFFCSEAFSVSI